MNGESSAEIAWQALPSTLSQLSLSRGWFPNECVPSAPLERFAPLCLFAGR
jgi:hypothetical protein